MAKLAVSVSLPVGMRNGRPLVSGNTDNDLVTVCELFDRIPFAKGGSAETGGVWPNERTARVAEVTAQIVRFQTVNRRPVIDGVIDPAGGTLKLMNQLAANPSPGTDNRVTVPPGYPGQVSALIEVADVTTLAGTGPLRSTWVTCNYIRRLVRFQSSSVPWFGVVMPQSGNGRTYGSVPHIHFTPTPAQGGYQDGTYDHFTAWFPLWDDYTRIIGGQLAASGADQTLIIPFYQNAQSGKLGDFLLDWKEVIAQVLTAAVNSADPYRLRDTFTFDRIVSSSFSNGWVTHRDFNSNAVGAAAMTGVLYDLDGQAAHPSSKNWRPVGRVAYLDLPPLAQGNPFGGTNWHVGGRWRKFSGFPYTHQMCRDHLLFHGLWQY